MRDDAMRYWMTAFVISVLPLGCGGALSGTVRPMKTYTVSTEGAEFYRTDSTEPVAVETPSGEAIRNLIETTASNVNSPIKPDGRLDALAAWLLENTRADGKSPPIEAIDFVSRHLGVPEPAPVLYRLGVSDANAMEHELEDNLPNILTGNSFTHYGLAVAGKGETFTYLAAVFSGRWFQMAEIRRGVEVNASLRLKGSLTSGYRHSSVTVTKPDGTNLEKKGDSGPRFDFSIPTGQNGTYRVELLAQGTHGPTVLANFPVYVGVAVPRHVAVFDDSGQKIPTDREGVVRELHRLVNQTRQQRGLKPLVLHAALSEVAQAHCVDMDQNGFVGHHSPQTGGMADRVRKAGIQSPIVMENIGQGPSAEEVHLGLMRSPAHRAAILAPTVTHIGLGVVVQKQLQNRTFLATELFIQVLDDIDIVDAPDEVLDMINDVRDARDLEEVDSDDTLNEYAQRAASSYFEQPKLTVDRLAKRTLKQLDKTAGRFSKVSFLPFFAGSLQEVKAENRLLDPTVQTVGIGVAQGSRKGEMPNAIFVVVIMASNR